MKTTELAWFAGFFDARGITMKQGVRINAVNFDNRLVLDIFQSRFGGHIGVTSSSSKKRQQRYWLLTGKKADEFLEAIRPYRLLDQAEEAHVQQILGRRK